MSINGKDVSISPQNPITGPGETSEEHLSSNHLLGANTQSAQKGVLDYTQAIG